MKLLRKLRELWARRHERVIVLYTAPGNTAVSLPFCDRGFMIRTGETLRITVDSQQSPQRAGLAVNLSEVELQ